MHEEYGGSTRAVDLAPEMAALVERAIAEVEEPRGFDLACGRVDLMRWNGGWWLSEFELPEPGALP